MLLIIHNLPIKIKYQEVKSLIQSKCGLSDVILDNLISEGRSKRVTVGLADDGDAAILVRKINGLFVDGQQLYVEDVRQAKASDQPFRASKSLLEESRTQDYQNLHQPMLSSSNFQQKDFTNNLGFQNASNNYQSQQQMAADPMMMNYNMPMGNMFYMPVIPPASNNYLGFGGQGQQVPPLFSAFSEISQQEQSFNMEQDNMTAMSQINSNNIWTQNEGRRDGNKSRQSFGERRPKPSANRGRSSSGANRRTRPDKRTSRWENNDPQMPRQRSRSPPRGNWNSRRRHEEPEILQNDFDNQYVMQDDMHQQSFNQQKPGTFHDHPEPSDDFGGHAEIPPSNDSRMNQSWHGRDSRNNRDNRNEARFFESRRGRPNTRHDKPVRGDSHVPRRSEELYSRRDGYHESTSKSSQSTNWREEPKVPPKRFRSRFENDEPPPKRQPKMKDRAPARSDNWREKPAPQQNPKNVNNHPPTAPIKTSKPKDDVVTTLNKDDTWRGQATSAIAKEMLKNLRIDIKPNDGILKNLKRSIRARINLIYNDRLSKNMEEILQKYRHKFPTSQDQAYFVTVLENIKNEGDSRDKGGVKSENQKGEMKAPSNEVFEGNAAKVSADEKPGSDPKEEKPGKPDVQTANSGENSGYLPKFVKDKKTNKQEKIKYRREFVEEVYTLPETLQKALDHEADILCDLFMGECLNPDDDNEKIVCETITDAAADDFRKVIRLQVTKRLLKIHNNLPIRIFCNGGKKPPRLELDTFLKQYGVISVRRSERSKSMMFIACVDTFENYDALCALGNADVGQCTLTFKPVHISGPPKKVTKAQITEAREKFIESQIDKSDEDLLKPGTTVQNNEIKQENDVEIVIVNDNQIKIDITSDHEDVIEVKSEDTVSDVHFVEDSNDVPEKIDATSNNVDMTKDNVPKDISTSNGQLYNPEDPNEPDDEDDIPDDIDEEDLEDY